MAIAPRSASIIVPQAFDWHEAAAHCRFTTATFRAWVRHGLLPAPSSATGRWHPEELSAALDRVSHEGHCNTNQTPARRAAYVPLPNVHRVSRRLVDGLSRPHYRHRKTGTKLPDQPGSPKFMTALIDCERRYAAQQQAEASAPKLPTHSDNQSPAAPQPSRETIPTPPKSVTQNSVRRGRPPSSTERLFRNSRRRAAVTQAEIARVIRAAKQAGAAEVQVRLSDSASIHIRLQPGDLLNSDDEIIL
jgi:hypothetical protein